MRKQNTNLSVSSAEISCEVVLKKNKDIKIMAIEVNIVVNTVNIVHSFRQSLQSLIVFRLKNRSNQNVNIARPVLLGGHNLFTLVEIELTDLPKSKVGKPS